MLNKQCISRSSYGLIAFDEILTVYDFMKSCPSLGLSIVGSHRTGKDRVMEEMFRWLFIAFIAVITCEQFCEVQGWTCLDSEDAEHSLSYCADISDSIISQDCDISEPTEEKTSGDAIKQKNTINPQEGSGDNQCITLHCKITNIGGLADCDGKCLKWNCKHKCCIVCHKEQELTHAVTTKVVLSPQDKNPSSDVTEERGSSSPKTVLLILLLCAIVILIIVVAVLFIRKGKLDKRNELSPTTYTTQGETVANVYADNGTSGGTAPAGNHIYDELDMLTQDPTPSNVYDNAQPTSVAVEMGRSADYVDIDLPMKDLQEPVGTSKVTLSLSPVYSQPFESPTSVSNTEYAEPFKPGTTNTATAPVLNHSIAAGDQQDDVYSLATAIPLSDPNVIYSQPNKATKSSEPTGKVDGATDPIHSETVGVVPGAGGVVTQDPNVVYAELMRSNTGAGGVITQDPNAVYTEPMKLKKSS